ncbi:hypothetical protein [Streptomyces sp. B1I3]|uniref:hypothetical protein n=1 Tax=Streptomyces sp. B1I3 TaxID=3042264 RepID=UPI002784701C|nr:hypothetical protein [Streptomyces sp. B1I3]MDQ0793577.1 hypothetical protein [Streptomyces sp. B1I3]
MVQTLGGTKLYDNPKPLFVFSPSSNRLDLDWKGGFLVYPEEYKLAIRKVVTIMNNTATVETKNMSVQAIWNIRDARGLNQAEKTFLFVVASRGVMTSAWQTAADDMGMKKDKFFNTRKALISKGLVREGLRKDDTTVYRLNEGALAALVPVKEKPDNSIVWDDAVEAPVEPVAVVEAPVVPEPAVEPQKAPESVVEATEPDEDLDDFEWDIELAAPVVEKPAKKTILAERLADKKTEKNADQETAERILDESDDAVEARRLFNDPIWNPMTTDLVQRASSAAFKVEKTLVTVSSKSVTDSFDEEW